MKRSELVQSATRTASGRRGSGAARAPRTYRTPAPRRELRGHRIDDEMYSLLTSPPRRINDLVLDPVEGDARAWLELLELLEAVDLPHRAEPLGLAEGEVAAGKLVHVQPVAVAGGGVLGRHGPGGALPVDQPELLAPGDPGAAGEHELHRVRSGRAGLHGVVDQVAVEGGEAAA